ncbi:hypothetical protein COTS27_00685 [Spirochaetota bacterium]|nr:hypothetical protein COTS27_00685 [Spirochaetota bacterium]
MIRFFINQHKALNLVFLLVIGFGILLFIYGRKDDLPNISLNLATIETSYPGAPADIVEQLVTDKIEEEIQGIDGRSSVISHSSEGRSVIYFEIQSNTTRLETDIRSDIETAISRINFPADVQQSVIEFLTFENIAINLAVGFVSKSKEVNDVETIKSLARSFRDEVRKIDGVGRVEFEDYPNLQVWAEVNPERLRFHELELNTVVSAIRARNLNISAGKVNLDGKEFFIKTTKEYASLEDIENTILRGNDTGQYVYLKDVATVRWAQEELATYKRYKEMSGVWLNVYKTSEGNTIAIVKEVKNLISEYEAAGLIPNKVEVVTTDDLSLYIGNILNILSSNATIGLLFIFLCMVIFFTFRVTFVTIISIPFAFCLGIIIMYALGQTLTSPAMFGMIIVLGMLVDDAILIAENVYAHTEKGLSPYQAAIKGTNEMVIPIFAIVSTTTLAFMAIASLPGDVGEVFNVIPITVIIMLLCSLLECLVILPGHLAHSKPQATSPHNSAPATTTVHAKKTSGRRWFIYVNARYKTFLETILKRPILVTSGFVLVLASASAIMFGTVSFVFFPGEAEYIVADIKTSKYNRLVQTEKIIDEAERRIRAVTPPEYVIDIISSVGADGTVDGDEYKLQQPYIGSIRVAMGGPANRDDEAILADIKAAISDVPGITSSIVTILKDGPPVGKPIDVYVKGSRITDTVTAAREVEAYIKSLPNLTSIDSSYDEGKEVVNINPSERLSSILNINLTSAAATISNAFADNSSTAITTLGEYSQNERNVDLVVKYTEDDKKLVQDIYNTPVRNQLGLNIPIKNFATVEFEKSGTLLSKEDGEFYISVSAYLVDEKSLDYNSSTLASMITDKIPEWEEKFPFISFEFKGQQEEEEEQSEALSFGLLIALFSIYFVLTIVFKSYIQPIVIMSIIPLGFVGVLFGLAITSTPLGLTPFLGAIALMGIIVNDSLVMVDKINRLRRVDKMSLIEATVEGARSRMRPILMTSITTVVGITPLAYGIAGHDPLLGDMAIALMWGIILSTPLLLIILPLFYVILDRLMSFIYRRFFKKEYFIVEAPDN